jgi:hypothetical protein
LGTTTVWLLLISSFKGDFTAVGADLAQGWENYVRPSMQFFPIGLSFQSGPEDFAYLLRKFGPCDLLVFSHVLFDVATEAGGLPDWFWGTLFTVQPSTIVLCIDRCPRISNVLTTELPVGPGRSLQARSAFGLLEKKTLLFSPNDS